MIGLPSALNWPKNVSLLRSSFESYPQTCLKTVIPDLCSKGEDLLMVRLLLLILVVFYKQVKKKNRILIKISMNVVILYY